MIDDSSNDGNKQQKSIIYYYVIIMIVVMLLNALLFPSVSQNRVTEVGYSEFLTMVDDGKVTEAAMDQQNNQIVFVTDDGNGNTAYYKTGIFPDDSLIDRLRENNVKFGSEICPRS